MVKKPVNELIKDERDREIDLKASRNARIVEGYAVAIIVIVPSTIHGKRYDYYYCNQSQ